MTENVQNPGSGAFFASAKSGQFMCYRTGQIYLLPTRYEQGSILVTSNLPFDEWPEVFGSERLTGALLDRLTHRVHILEMNGESYRLAQSQKRRLKRPESEPA
jgi:hypothetical protein